MDGLMKLMAKKKADKPLDENYKSAKMEMLKSLKGEMGKMMGDDLKSSKMKAVQVAAPDKEGLEKGLDTAKDLIEGAPEGEKEGMPMDEESEVEAMCDEMSPEELDEMIKMLEAKKAEKQMKV